MESLKMMGVHWISHNRQRGSGIGRKFISRGKLGSLVHRDAEQTSVVISYKIYDVGSS